MVYIPAGNFTMGSGDIPASKPEKAVNLDGLLHLQESGYGGAIQKILRRIRPLDAESAFVGLGH